MRIPSRPRPTANRREATPSLGTLEGIRPKSYQTRTASPTGFLAAGKSGFSALDASDSGLVLGRTAAEAVQAARVAEHLAALEDLLDRERPVELDLGVLLLLVHLKPSLGSWPDSSAISRFAPT